MQLSVDAIVTAAVDILDSYGLADMTMRRVASRLGVAPGALYWHVANKQELIGTIAERILSPVLDTPATDARRAAAMLREALLSHRDGAELVAAAFSMPSSTLALRTATVLAESLRPLGLAAGERDAGARALLHQVLGATSLEQAQQQFSQLTGETPAFRHDGAYGVNLLLTGLRQRGC